MIPPFKVDIIVSSRSSELGNILFAWLVRSSTMRDKREGSEEPLVLPLLAPLVCPLVSDMIDCTTQERFATGILRSKDNVHCIMYIEAR